MSALRTARQRAIDLAVICAVWAVGLMLFGGMFLMFALMVRQVLDLAGCS